MATIDQRLKEVTNALQVFPLARHLDPRVRQFETTISHALCLMQAVLKDTKEGCAMAPLEASEAMEAAAATLYEQCRRDAVCWDEAMGYRAMLDAAPEAEANKVLQEWLA